MNNNEHHQLLGFIAFILLIGTGFLLTGSLMEWKRIQEVKTDPDIFTSSTIILIGLFLFIVAYAIQYYLFLNHEITLFKIRGISEEHRQPIVDSFRNLGYEIIIE